MRIASYRFRARSGRSSRFFRQSRKVGQKLPFAQVSRTHWLAYQFSQKYNFLCINKNVRCLSVTNMEIKVAKIFEKYLQEVKLQRNFWQNNQQSHQIFGLFVKKCHQELANLVSPSVNHTTNRASCERSWWLRLSRIRAKFPPWRWRMRGRQDLTQFFTLNWGCWT